MSRELVIRTNQTLGKIEVVLIENDQIVEYRVQEIDGDNIGDVYAGKVTDFVKSYNASFVDIGLDKPGFVSGEILPNNSKVLVQVFRQAHENKGVSLTTNINLSGSYCVITPGVFSAGVSHKIRDKDVLTSVTNISNEIHSTLAEQYPNEQLGVIIRTSVAKLVDDDDNQIIKDEAIRLAELWLSIKSDFSNDGSLPRLIYSEGDLAVKMIKDLTTNGIDKIIVDDAKYASKLRIKLAQSNGEIAEKVGILPKILEGKDIYEVKSINSKLSKLMHRKVWLPSGAYILIEPTEAMTVIDVNSGKYTATQDKDKSALKVNLEGATEIMRQLRLRNMGGIVICDFIDMKSSASKASLLEHMRSLAASDSGKTIIVDITPLGLVEITRKRIRKSCQPFLIMS